MKKKIGFIDLSIDEWHANNYPKWIKESKRSEEFQLAYAWEEKPNDTGRALHQWCKEFNVEPTESIEEIVEKSDALFILAPSNPEVHFRLAEIPLQSGKPMYIDKPFAPDKKTAERMFVLAERHGTPMFSSSALRFSDEIMQLSKEIGVDRNAEFAITTGGGSNFPEYAIHQLEMLVMCMGCGAKSVVNTSQNDTKHLIIKYSDKRSAAMTFMPGIDFGISCYYDKKAASIKSCSNFFHNLINAILDFFVTKESPVPKEQTIEISALLEAGVKGANNTFREITIQN